MSYRPIADTWFLARPKLKGGGKYYGAYLGGFPERGRALLAATIEEPVLHVCGGCAKLYPYGGGFGPNDKTLDLDPLVQPDFIQDAREPYPAGFKAVLADPPYSETDADKYAPGREKYPAPGRILRLGLDAVPPGGRVGILHYLLPQPPKGVRFVACITLVAGFNNRGRFFSVFEKSSAG
jgi:hypothetical protein